MITLNVHDCSTITARRSTDNEQSNWLDITYTTSEGTVFQITAFFRTESGRALAHRLETAINLASAMEALDA